MIENVILHVGSPKTGSTHLQSFLARNKTVLLEEFGVLYSSSGRSGNAHHNLAYQLGGSHLQAKFKKKNGGILEIQRECCQSHAHTLLISSEALFHFSPTCLLNLRKSFECSNLHVVVYLRRQEEYLQSGYQQNHKYGRVVETPFEFCVRKAAIADYYLFLKKLLAAFGTDSITIHPYLSRRDGFDVRTSFCSTINIDSSRLDFSSAYSSENSALSIYAHSFLRHLFASGQLTTNKPFPPGFSSRIHEFDRVSTEPCLRYSFLNQHQAGIIRSQFVKSNRRFQRLLKQSSNCTGPNLHLMPLVKALGLPSVIEYNQIQQDFYRRLASDYGLCFDLNELFPHSLFSTPLRP